MFPGFGTLVNVALIIVGGLVGLIAGKHIRESLRETLTVINGIAVLLMAAGGLIANMLVLTDEGFETSGTLMMIICLAVGAVIGELCRIDAGVAHLGEWLKKKSGNGNDNSFVGAFVTASCTVCIGAMAVVGSVEDGIGGNSSTLIAKGILDAIIICMMASSAGKGAIFSAIPVAIFQGSITLLAFFFGTLLPAPALHNLSLVGSVLIFAVGVNLAFDKKIRVANLLPSLVLAALWGCFF